MLPKEFLWCILGNARSPNQPRTKPYYRTSDLTPFQAGHSPPRRISTDHDPVFTHHRWHANLRVLGIEEVKTVPYVPLSHPFVERVIGSVRRGYLDHILFWNETDLSRKLDQYQKFYNETRGHLSLKGKTPEQTAEKTARAIIPVDNFNWASHCNGLFNTPIAC